MANKDKKASSQELSSNNETAELEQLRQIIFGEAQNRLINQISIMRSDLEKALDAQKQSVSEQFAQLKEATNAQFLALDTKLKQFDEAHNSQDDALQKKIEQLASEHEMFATVTQQDFKQIEQSLDNESASLASNFNEQLEQLKAHLEEVSTDLSSSKTDRKTLASLLATMATNLQDEAL